LFLPICLSGGNNPYDLFLLPIAVTYDENSEGRTQAKENKAILFLRMLRVRHDPRILIKEGASGFLERNPVLLVVRTILPFIPLKHQVRHGVDIVTTL
jgi:hypothetical protein